MSEKNLKLANAALGLVVAYDDLMRQYTGPISDISEADNAAIDEAYDQMVFAAHTTLDVVSRPSPQDQLVGCPCTTFEQDEDCPVGQPSLLCWACEGKGIAPIDKVVALAAEMMKVAEQVDELEDPFAAWESIELLKSSSHPAPSQDVVAIKPLEWRQGYSNDIVTISQADTIGGIYQVRVLDSVVWLDTPRAQTIYPTVGEAKAAAQAAHDHAILSRLETNRYADGGKSGEV